MKTHALLLISIFGLSLITKAQEVNWRSLPVHSQNLVVLNFGGDYDTAIGLAYGRRLRGKIPVVLGLEIAVPFGKTLFDDWEVKATA